MPLLRDGEPGLEVEVEVLPAGVPFDRKRQGGGESADEDQCAPSPFSLKPGSHEGHGMSRSECFAPPAMVCSLKGSAKVVPPYQKGH